MAELLYHLAPRYIFVAGVYFFFFFLFLHQFYLFPMFIADFAYERLPWMNRFQNVSRFFVLAPLNNTTKAKVIVSTIFPQDFILPLK